MLNLRDTNALCRLLADASRLRLLTLLAQSPLSIAELVRITGLSQSRVSTHVGRLKSAGLVQSTKVGPTSRYAAAAAKMDEDTRAFWTWIKGSLEDPLLDGDERRLADALRAREEPSTWAETVAGHMERHYAPGRTWEATARAFVGLAQLEEVLDVASGDGALAELFAPVAKRVTCLDVSEDVVAAGRRRLEQFDNVDFVLGDMHRIPFDAASFDQVLALNALTYAIEPVVVLEEIARVLRPGGRLVVVTLLAHEHAETVEAYNHQNLGFELDQLSGMLRNVGFTLDFSRATHAERRPPHFEVVTIYATRK